MTKSMTRIKHNLLKYAFYRYMLWMSVSLLVLFFIIYLITVSFHQKRDENLKEINLNFYTEIMMMKNATDNMLALLYAEQPDLEDFRQITNLSLAEYYEYKTTTYMKHAGSKYNGTQNQADIFQAVVTAFRNEGLATGAYYSKPDWHSSYYWLPEREVTGRYANYDPKELPEVWQKYDRFVTNQLIEISQNYGQLDILWLDGGWV